jgi:hypothetical protein
MPKSYAPEVQTVGDGDKWSGNALRFAKPEDAEAWVEGLSYRWTAVKATRVVESEDEPNR